MKKVLILATSLAAFAAAAIAAPIDPKGIPADAQGIVHIDFDVLSKTDFGKLLKQQVEKGIASQSSGEGYMEFKKLTGIDPMTDLFSITVGLSKEDGRTEPKAVGVARGKFSPEKYIAAAKEQKCSVTTQGGLTIIDPSEITKKKPSDKNFLIGVVDDKTILFAENATQLTAAAAALAGKGKSYSLAASLDVFRTQEGTPMVLAYLGSALTPNEEDGGGMVPLSKAESYLISLGENGPNVRTRFYSDYASPEAARKMQSGLQGLLAFANMMAMQGGSSGKPGAEEQAQALQQLLAGVKISQNGKALDVSIDYPTSELTRLIKKYADK